MVNINLHQYSYKFMKVRYKKPLRGPKLTIELIPKSAQGHSLYHFWPQKHWDRLRKLVYSRADRKCEVCGGGPEIECHEVWEFDIEKRTQKLVCLVCLCTKCHRAKHFGHAYLSGHGREAIKHLMKVNGWTLERTLLYIDIIYSQHKKYKGIKFKKKLNLSLLDDFILKFQIKNRRTKRVKVKDKKAKSKERKISKNVGSYKKSGRKRRMR